MEGETIQMDAHAIANDANATVEATVETTVETPVEHECGWECTICYGDGSKTGKITLACSHEVCLGCYTKMGTMATRNLSCPICRAGIRTSEGLEEHEKRRVRESLAQVIRNEEAIVRAEQFLAATRDGSASHKRTYEQLLRDLKITDAEAREIRLEAIHAPAPAPIRIDPGLITHAPHALPPQPAPMRNERQEGTQARCPGCRTMRAEGLIRFRHIRDSADGGTRRLRRCGECQDAAQRLYEQAARARIANLGN